MGTQTLIINVTFLPLSVEDMVSSKIDTALWIFGAIPLSIDICSLDENEAELYKIIVSQIVHNKIGQIQIVFPCHSSSETVLEPATRKLKIPS